MTIDSIIVEDELHNRNNLAQLLITYCPEVNIVASCADADEAMEAIYQFKPQLVFLDIQMPGRDAFDLLADLKRIDFEIIFVTAYSEYGIKAVKFSAIDYLLKPIDINELKSAVVKAFERIKLNIENRKLLNLLHYLKQADKSDHRIAIASLKEIRLVPVSDIVRCESDNTYTLFHLQTDEKILSTSSILHYEELLSEYGFLRCHQSHLVNRKYIRSLLKSDGYYLSLNNNVTIPVSRSKRDLVQSEILRLK